MRKKRGKLLLPLLLSALLCPMLIGGCGTEADKPQSTSESAGASSNEKKTEEADKAQKEETVENTDYPEYLNLDSYYPFVKDEYKDQIELNIAIIVTTDFSEDPYTRYYWQLMEKVFNMKCNVTQVTNGQEYLSMAFASDDLPDIIIGAQDNFSGSQLYSYAVLEAQLLNWAPYVDETLMPRLSQVFKEYPDVKAGITFPDGGMYAFPYIMDPKNIEIMGIGEINMELLQKAGISEKPKTLDELTSVLYAFKDLGSDVLPVAGNWENQNPSGIILRALGYETCLDGDSSAISISLKNGKVVLPAADEGFKEYLEVMNQYYKDGIISKDFFTEDLITLQAQCAEKQVGVIARNMGYLNASPEVFQKYEAIPVLTSDANKEGFSVEKCYYTFGGCFISSKTEYPELCLRWADWMMTNEGTHAGWVGGHKNNEQLKVDGYGGWYMDENYSRRDVDRDENPDTWTGAVEYLRQKVAGFNMGSLGYVIGEDAYRQSLSGLKERAPEETWALDPTNAAYFYRTSAHEEYADYLRTDISTMKFFFDEETNDRIIEIESVLMDKMKNEIANFITGTRSLDEFDSYLEELEALGAGEYVSYYEGAYQIYQENLTK